MYGGEPVGRLSPQQYIPLVLCFKIKNGKIIDINHLYVSLAHSHLLSVLKATTQQYRNQLVGELASCIRCSLAKGVRASTPHHTASRLAAPIDIVHIDVAGSFKGSLGGSRYVMFVDRQCFMPPAPVQSLGQERIRQSR